MHAYQGLVLRVPSVCGSRAFVAIRVVEGGKKCARTAAARTLDLLATGRTLAHIKGIPIRKRLPCWSCWFDFSLYFMWLCIDYPMFTLFSCKFLKRANFWESSMCNCAIVGGRTETGILLNEFSYPARKSSCHPKHIFLFKNKVTKQRVEFSSFKPRLFDRNLFLDFTTVAYVKLLTPC